MTDLYENPRSYFQGRNFMTPTIIKYGKRGLYAYELSTGHGVPEYTGSRGDPIFGVTVARRDNGEIINSLCTCHHSLKDAEEAIFLLRWEATVDG